MSEDAPRPPMMAIQGIASRQGAASGKAGKVLQVTRRSATPRGTQRRPCQKKKLAVMSRIRRRSASDCPVIVVLLLTGLFYKPVYHSVITRVKRHLRAHSSVVSR